LAYFNLKSSVRKVDLDLDLRTIRMVNLDPDLKSSIRKANFNLKSLVKMLLRNLDLNTMVGFDLKSSVKIVSFDLGTCSNHHSLTKNLIMV